jgi:hypothetical protein
MFKTRQNFHHSRLPALGALVQIHADRCLRPGHRYRTFIVECYPLCDNDHPYSLGIHTVYVRALDNGERHKVSGHFCVELDHRP